MDNFGLDLETREYNIQNLNASYISFGAVSIFMLMVCIFVCTRRRRVGHNRVRREYTV
jgi:hypothetical protein